MLFSRQRSRFVQQSIFIISPLQYWMSWSISFWGIMYTSSMRCCYTLRRVLRLPGYDSSHNVNWTICAYIPDTTTDIYTSNNNNSLSIRLVPDWRLTKDSPTWQGSALLRSSSTLREHVVESLPQASPFLRDQPLTTFSHRMLTAT